MPLGEVSGGALHDTVPSCKDDKEEVLNRVANEELAAVLWGMVEELPGQQSEVLKMRFKDNMKLREIGAVCGCSIDRARQIENKGLRTLRNPKRSRILREFLDDERIYNSALHGNGVGSFSRSWTSSTEKIAMKMIEKEQELKESRLNYYREVWGEDFEENRDVIDRLVESDLEIARA